jgi:LmbE family N-acetylglucosaminyl deacetylase
MFENQSYRTFLVVVAHHDDEALFFGGALTNIANKGLRKICIVVLTDVEYENKPTTDEQRSNDPQRRARRLHAFYQVAHDLSAVVMHLNLPQVQCLSAPDAMIVENDAYTSLHRLYRKLEPDCILTHGREGEYTAEKYAHGWEEAREQHKLAYRLVRRLPYQIPLGHDQPAAKWAYDINGELHVEFDHDAKAKLLAYYRTGCTQEAEWRPELTYPEFVATERFTTID